MKTKILKINHQRIKSEHNYYKNPNICKTCGKVIEVKPHERVAAVKAKEYCDHTCSARRPNLRSNKTTICATGVCFRCSNLVAYSPISGSSVYRIRKYCCLCLDRVTSNTYKKRDVPLSERTKDEVFKNINAKTPGRAAIQCNAKAVYKKSNKPKVCFICGYSIAFQICHIKPVAYFAKTALIKEINHVDNLIGLCPNHHWELDHGYIKLNLKQNLQ